MDSSKGEKFSLATNVEQLSSTIPDKNVLPKKSMPVPPYIPPHRRRLSSTEYYVKFAPRESDLEYNDDCSDTIIELPKTDQIISSTNALSDNSASVCSRTSTDLKKNISVYEKQTLKLPNRLPWKALNIEQTSFKNNTEEKNIPVFQSQILNIVDIDAESESESSKMYNTNEKKKESDIDNIQTSFATGNTFEKLFASNIKAAVQSLPVLEKYDKTNNLSISISNDVKKVKSKVEEYNEMSNLSISTSNSTRKVSDNVKKEKNDDLIIQKILDLANAHVNITFKTMLNELYSKKYSEDIPSKILLYSVLQKINFFVSVNDELSKIEIVSPTDEERLSKNNISFQFLNMGPNLLTSEDIGGEFLVKIYNCKSVTEIWGQIMNANNLEKLDKLLKEMKKFYDSKKLVASSIKKGGFYVVLKDNFWHRVKCLKCNEFTAVVLFIDRGDESTFPLREIYELDDKFVLIPAQAIKMNLSNLEVFSDCDEAFIILKDKLHERTVYATMLFYSHENNCWDVKLYLKIYEEKINIADLVIDQLLKISLNPKFNIQTEEIIRVQVSSVNEKGIFIQLIQSKSYTYFMKLLRNVITKCLDSGNIRHELKLNENKLYLVKNHKTNRWYRAKILKFKNEREVEALLIDTGTNICMNGEVFFLLEKFSSILTKYPEQAIKVQVHELSNFYEQETLEHFRKLIKSTNIFFASFITKTLQNNNIPTIRLFKKESNNLLTPINDKLLLNQQSQIKSTIVVPLKESDSSDDIVTLQLQRMSKMRELLRSLSPMSISTVLDPPQIPKDSCDVHVILADNPSKFVIQLLSSKSVELKKLDYELSAACNSYKGSQLTVESIKIGQLYAAKYDEYDSKWYRVYLLQVTDIKLASIYYCDYGYYKEVKIENIVPLETQFYQLPYQAVWAELHGIKPIFERWTLDDASRFRDLTQLKDFVCIIKSKKSFKPKNYKALMPITVETIYSLELVDTTTEDDIYIDDILVDERRALKSDH